VKSKFFASSLRKSSWKDANYIDTNLELVVESTKKNEIGL